MEEGKSREEQAFQIFIKLLKYRLDCLDPNHQDDFLDLEIQAWERCKKIFGRENAVSRFWQWAQTVAYRLDCDPDGG